MDDKVDSLESQAIHDEIVELERRLEDAKARLKGSQNQEEVVSSPPSKLLPSDGKMKDS